MTIHLRFHRLKLLSNVCLITVAILLGTQFDAVSQCNQRIPSPTPANLNPTCGWTSISLGPGEYRTLNTFPGVSYDFEVTTVNTLSGYTNLTSPGCVNGASQAATGAPAYLATGASVNFGINQNGTAVNSNPTWAGWSSQSGSGSSVLRYRQKESSTIATPTASATPTTVCSGGAVTLTATGVVPGGQGSNTSGVLSLTGGSTIGQVQVANSAALQVAASEDFTYEMWVKPSSFANGNNTYFENGSWGGQTILFRQDNPTTIYLYINSAPPYNNLPYAPPVGQWTHLAVVRSGATISLFADGCFVGHFTTTYSSAINPTNVMRIGSSVHTGAQRFKGEIDEFRMWKGVAVSQANRDTYRTKQDLSGHPNINNLSCQYRFNGDYTNSSPASSVSGTGTPSNAAFAAPNGYNYTWSGPGAPGSSTNEVQTTNSTSASSYTVVASRTGYTNSASSGATSSISFYSTTNTPGTITGPTSACPGGSYTISNTAVAATGSPASSAPSYRFYRQKTDEPNLATWVDISGLVSTSSFTTGIPNAPGTYQFQRRSSFSCPGTQATSNTITVTVYNNFAAGTIQADQQLVCPSPGPATLTSINNAVGGNGTYSYQWQVSTNNSSFSNISGATGTTYTPPSTLGTRYYRRGVSETSGCFTSPVYTGEPQDIAWTDANSGTTVNGTTITKTGGANGVWDEGASSLQNVVRGGYIEFRAGETNTHKMMGLNSDPTSNHSYSSIDYAMYPHGSGAMIQVYESGNYRGQFTNYVTGDILRVEWTSNDQIVYKKNGVVFYTSTVAPSGVLYGDLSLYHSNASFTNVVIQGDDNAEVTVIDMTASVGVTDVSCNGGSDGVVSANITGGVLPYTYSWSPGGQTTAVVGSRSAGTYTVTVTDATGCTATANATVGQPATSVSLTSSLTNETCPGDCNGSINITPSGGTQYNSKPNALHLESNLVLWANGDNGVVRDFTDNVSQWSDLSGSGNHITQSSSGNRPTWVSSAINSEPVVRFNTSQWMATATNFGTPYTIFTISKMNGGATNRLISSYSTNWLMGYHGGSVNDIYANGWVYNPSAAAGTSANLHTVTGTGGITTLYNCATAYGGNGAGVSGPGRLRLNGWSTGLGETSNGDVAEVIMYNRVLTAAELQGVRNYLSNKYNMGCTGGNPYTYSWTGPSSYTSTQEDITGLCDGDYTVTVTDANGCSVTSPTITIGTTYTESTAPGAISGVTSICNGASTTLSINPATGVSGSGSTYQWFSSSCGGTSAGTGTSITVSPSSTTEYFVRRTGTCNTTTCSSIIVTVVSATLQPIEGDQTISCGTTTTFSSNEVSEFTVTGSNNYTVPTGYNGQVEVLVVAGGGGGGTNMGGGGGGGGVIHNEAYSVTSGQVIPITVGAGGAGAPAGTGGHPAIPGSNGGNSVFGSLTAIGGGRGGLSPNWGLQNGVAGGSGGGASGYNHNGAGVGATPGGAGTLGQGFNGGHQGSAYYSGGGGGAGGPGWSGNGRGHGGPGYLCDINGTAWYWAGGGGGAGYSGWGGNGGIGGGGGGAVGSPAGSGGVGYNNGSAGTNGCTGCQSNIPGGNAGANTGGGGGGGSHYEYTNKGGDGGSGIVIVSAPSTSGSWSSNNTSVATVNSSGVVTGVSAGTATISYTANAGGCGSSTVTRTVTVESPISPTITGVNSFCAGETATFSVQSLPTGGTITTSIDGAYKIHSFTSTGTSVFNSPVNLNAEVMVVGGGGSGGPAIGGGGGGGGVVHMPNVSISSGASAIVVGAGGATTNTTFGANGGNSTAFGATAAGGGSSGRHDVQNGSAGGSGGGAASNNSVFNTGGASNGNSLGSNTGVIYGNAGGYMTAPRYGSPTRAAGGGGAGAPAANVRSSYQGDGQGNGGDGIQIDILGPNYYWGAGGGGGTHDNGTNGGGNGGLGGAGGGSGYNTTGGLGSGGGLNAGANGLNGSNLKGGNAGANTGSGGGGGSWSSGQGGNGGSGIVVVKYLDYTNGAWSSSNTSVATVNSSTGVVTTVAGGTTIISYTICSTVVNYPITVHSLSVAPTGTSGTSPICDGSSTTLTATGGTLGTGAAAYWYEGSVCGPFSQNWLTQPYGAVSATTTNSVAGGILNVTSTTNDPTISMSGLGSFNPNVYQYVNVRYRVLSGTAGNTEIFFYNTAHAFAVGGESASGSLISDGQWHTLSINMASDPDYTTGGNITGWRYDWATANGVTMELDYITLTTTPVTTTPSPTSTTSYVVRYEGQCNVTACAASISIVVHPNPTLSTTVQATVSCGGSNATINLTGMLPNVTSSITYNIGGGTPVTVTGVVSNSSGNASFNASVVTANHGQTLTITNISTTSLSPTCNLAPPLSGNTDVLEVVSGTINAGYKTWTGAESADWTDYLNWDCGGVPLIGQDVIIPAGSLPNEPTIFGPDQGKCNTIQVLGSTIVTIESDLNADLEVGNP